MYKKSKDSVYVHIGAGLGNRLMSVVGIIVMSIYYQSKPIILNWNEFDLFYYIKDYNITSKIYYSGKLNTICPSNVEKIELTKTEQNIHYDYLWCDLLYDLLDSIKFKQNIYKLIYGKKHNNKLHTMFFLYHYFFNRIIKVKANIEKEANCFINKFNKIPFVGVQIRVGNEDLREQVFSDKDDIEVMINVLTEKFNKNIWFVTGDSQKTKLKLLQTYKNAYVYTKERAKHYERCKTDLTTIIEHEILSKSTFMVISKSTFGLTALLKSGIFLSDKNNLSYEITRKNAYDVKSNFKKITSTWHLY